MYDGKRWWRNETWRYTADVEKTIFEYQENKTAHYTPKISIDYNDITQVNYTKFLGDWHWRPWLSVV